MRREEEEEKLTRALVIENWWLKKSRNTKYKSVITKYTCSSSGNTGMYELLSVNCLVTKVETRTWYPDLHVTSQKHRRFYKT